MRILKSKMFWAGLVGIGLVLLFFGGDPESELGRDGPLGIKRILSNRTEGDGSTLGSANGGKPNYEVISDWVEYRDEEGGFSFKYPPEMVSLPKSYKNQYARLMLFGPEQPRLVRQRVVDGLEVVVKYEEKVENIPFERWMRLTLPTNAVIDGQDEIRVYGFDAIRVRGQGDEPFDVVGVELDNNNFISLSASYKGKGRLTYQSIFEKMIDSLVIQ